MPMIYSLFSLRRKQRYQSTGSVDEKLEAIMVKKERLGLSFADGAISRETYRKRLQETTRPRREPIIYSARGPGG